MPEVTRSTTVVFDLGGVLIDWDPRHLYRQLFEDPDEMEVFLAEVTTAEWNAHQDAGRPWVEAIEILVAEHPERRELIEAFHRRWPGRFREWSTCLPTCVPRASDWSRSATGRRRCSQSRESVSTSWRGSRGSSSRARSG